MNERRLGRSLVVSALGFGCMALAGPNAAGPELAAAEALVRRAVERGICFFDTADVYGLGASESLLGRCLAPIRDQVVLATKAGIRRGADGAFLGIDGSPAHLRASCEASLRRLGTGTIDLLILHRVDPAIPVEDSVGEMSRLVAEGKVRFLGLSEAAPDSIRRAHATHRLAAVESEYSLLTRDPEADTLACVRALNIGFIAASPLGRGLLTGTLHRPEDLPEGDARRAQPRFFAENFARNVALVRIVEDMAHRLRCTPAQLALAFLLAQGSDVVPIPGPRSEAEFDENLGALEVPLSAEDLGRLMRAVPPGAAAGARQVPEQMATFGR
ncbi:MAG TPA: aldo/keto reductase [Acidiphilium sp.]|uniref:aldo/keto reductase n=1 Tax=unclassified Acidiphilium TaxID=2617493 RepID=UPI000BCB2D45|nr:MULTISPECIES: aldo/keto reductase [unclassified Acidiphilium]OYV55791.1 MAG: aldo/keto reductase [Acidiphilium sp. 20-67-58]HQT60286.1 aldo/keto reductase [Acidiphilium sp.]HQU11826.1 aldo/keto reductase [Acidiphilium sp.]